MYVICILRYKTQKCILKRYIANWNQKKKPRKLEKQLKQAILLIKQMKSNKQTEIDFFRKKKPIARSVYKIKS